MKRFNLIAVVLTALFTSARAEAGDVFTGRQIYIVHCTSCHGDNGVPLLPGTPNLARGEGLIAPDQLVLRSLRYGKGSMPGFESMIGRKELLDVLAYVRTLRR